MADPTLAPAVLEAQLIDLGTRMLKALEDAGLSPFTDPTNLLVLQILGPVAMKMVGDDMRVSLPQIIEIADQVDLEQLMAAIPSGSRP